MVTNIADHTIYDPLKPLCAPLLQQSLFSGKSWRLVSNQLQGSCSVGLAPFTQIQSNVGQLGYFGWRLRPLLINYNGRTCAALSQALQPTPGQRSSY